MEKKKASLKMPFKSKKQLEIEKLSEEMYKRNLELAEINQALSLLRTIDDLVLGSHEELAVLCQNIADAIIDKSNFPFVAVMANPVHKDYFELLGCATAHKDQVTQLLLNLKLDEHNRWLVSPDRVAVVDLDTEKVKYAAHVLNNKAEDFEKLLAVFPIKSVILVKLFSRHRLVGVLAVGLHIESAEVPTKDKDLIERLSEAVGIALDNRLLFEENQQVLRQLQKSNEKLKTMDETKDEFISMASHQLRTPLTSVKGYVSMVLEGDAGPLNDMQRKLLEQSFTSSQRMVFLIADLLNLSRLKTGKFVIEAHPTNLADVIESEVEQLSETAAGRNLKLVYERPEDFPTLMLDETKIRQVIMNFIDNAIYYTPAGGKIEISLTETAKTVEFAVKDDGIGVPPSEQPHLFTKFYRAKNAQQARPDGTGLGLFMAKKVIIAQKGALIFKSTVGKGSTFGFSFAKDKVKLPEEAPNETPDVK